MIIALKTMILLAHVSAKVLLSTQRTGHERFFPHAFCYSTSHAMSRSSSSRLLLPLTFLEKHVPLFTDKIWTKRK